MDSIVMFDYETGRSRGFGFVTYEDPAVARYLLSLGHEHNTGPNPHLTGRVQMRDKLVEIKAAEPKEGHGRPQVRPAAGSRRKAITEATVVPEAYPVTEENMYNYGTVYPGMAGYGYVPGYGAPAYAAAPMPYPAGYVQGYMAPVYYPQEMAMPPAPVMQPEQPNVPFAGYAFIPFVPPPTAPQQQN